MVALASSPSAPGTTGTSRHPPRPMPSAVQAASIASRAEFSRRKTIARPHQAAGTSARGIGSRTPAPSPVRRSAATAPRWRRAPSPSSTPSRIVREACPVASARKPIPQASRSRRRLSTDGCTECAPSSECGLSACCCDLAGVGGGTKRRLAPKVVACDADRRKGARDERKDVCRARRGVCHGSAHASRRGRRSARKRVRPGGSDPFLVTT